MIITKAVIYAAGAALLASLDAQVKGLQAVVMADRDVR